MKNRILGIAVLLAVLALGLAFISCPQDTEDRELTFINETRVSIIIITDGTPATLTLAPPLTSTAEGISGTVKKTGSDITLTSISSSDGTVKSDPYRYIDFEISVTGVTEVKNTVKLGSGTIVIKAQTLDKEDDNNPFNSNTNPALWPN